MNKKWKNIVILTLCVLLTGSLCLSWWLYSSYVSPEETAALSRADELSDSLNKANETIRLEEIRIADLLAELDADGQEIALLEKKVTALIDSHIASDEYQTVLLDELEKLKRQYAEKEEKLAELTDRIQLYTNLTTLDFAAQAKQVSDLLMLAAEVNRPLRTWVTDDIQLEESEESAAVETSGLSDSSESVDPKQIEESAEQPDFTDSSAPIELRPAQLSFYYQDLDTGYTISYNSEEILYSASLIKVPYIYSMLKAIAEFEECKLTQDAEGNPLYDEEGVPLFEGQHPNLDEEGNILYREGEEKYNLNRTWVYDADTMQVEGSGLIQSMESGTEMTYRELVEYAIRYSDNVAFAQLRSMFGYTEYYREAHSLGIRGIRDGFMQLSAEDCGKFLTAMYPFLEENEAYGTLLKESMIHSNYAVLIPSAVYPTLCAHKYGWDKNAYHDMAIVYNDHPYVLVVMTDLDQGGTEANAYIRKIVSSLCRIHATFYADPSIR